MDFLSALHGSQAFCCQAVCINMIACILMNPNIFLDTRCGNRQVNIRDRIEQSRVCHAADLSARRTQSFCTGLTGNILANAWNASRSALGRCAGDQCMKQRWNES